MDDSWSQPFEDFRRRCKGMEVNSADFYYWQLVTLLRWASVPLEDFKAGHMEEYLSIRKTTNFGKKPASARTRRHDYDAADKFFRFCVDRDYLSSHPYYNSRNVLVVDRPKKEDPLLKTPEHGELRDLLQTVRQRWDINLPPPKGWKPGKTKRGEHVQRHPAKYYLPKWRTFHMTRDLAILECLICSGMRSGELTGLALEDFEPHYKMMIEGRLTPAPRMLIRESKTDTPRIVYLTPDCAKTVKTWLRAREGCLGNKRTDPVLFIGKKGNQLDSGWWTHRFAYYRKLACQKGYRSHDIRHRAGTDAYKVNPVYAQQKLGHRDIRTTINVYGHREEAWVAQMTQQVDTLSEVKRGRK